MVVVAFERLPAAVVYLGVPLTSIASCSVNGIPPGNVAMDAWADGAFGTIVLSFAFALLGIRAVRIVGDLVRWYRE